jgi:hypothetical protein
MILTDGRCLEGVFVGSVGLPFFDSFVPLCYLARSFPYDRKVKVVKILLVSVSFRDRCLHFAQ